MLIDGLPPRPGPRHGDKIAETSKPIQVASTQIAAAGMAGLSTTAVSVVARFKQCVRIWDGLPTTCRRESGASQPALEYHFLLISVRDDAFWYAWKLAVDLTLIEAWMDTLDDEEYDNVIAALEQLEEER